MLFLDCVEDISIVTRCISRETNIKGISRETKIIVNSSDIPFPKYFLAVQINAKVKKIRGKACKVWWLYHAVISKPGLFSNCWCNDLHLLVPKHSVVG